jgi:DNA repair protein RadC
VVLLNIKDRYLMHTEVSIGSQSASLVHPREVFGPAVREGAAKVLLCHNHPSGDPEPSPEDRELTRRLAECGMLLGTEVLDHVIVGNGTDRWVSLRDRGEF